MERNTDSKIVVMDREVYYKLRHLAGVGASEIAEDLSSCDRHVRRFNEAIKAEAAAERRAEIEMRRAARLAAYDLLRRKQGQDVYYRYGSHHYLPGKLIEIEQRRDGYPLLRMLLRGQSKVSFINASNVFDELPPGAQIYQRNPTTGELALLP